MIRNERGAEFGRARAKHLTRPGVLSVACALMLGASAVASAASQVVYYGDLDLSDAVASKALHARIKRAADLVCGPVDGIRDIRAWRNYKQCAAEATRNAMAQVEWPTSAEP